MLPASWKIFVQLAPWLLLGTVIAGILHVALPQGMIRNRLRGFRGVLQAVFLGVPLPLCSCGVIPAGIGLKRDGASDGAAVGFLISTPQTGIDSVLVSASFLGWPFAIFKVFVAGITGVIGGVWAELGAVDAAETGSPVEGPESPRGWVAAWEHGLEVVRSIWVWLVIGVVVSAAIEVFVPDSFFQQLQAWGTAPSAVAALLISLPLYVCATASVPIAGVLVANGLPAGAAIVFLMAGPATNVATIGAIYRALGRRVLVIYLTTIIGGSLVSAVIFDWVLPGQMQIAHDAIHEHGTGWFAQACAVLLLLLFLRFAWQDSVRWLRHRQSAGTPSDDDGLRLSVEGMSCNNCVTKLETALRQQDGVESVQVHLDPGEAIVTGSIDEAAVRSCIHENGFRVPTGEAPTQVADA